jgi:membrane-associated phospholipid phosphatase
VSMSIHSPGGLPYHRFRLPSGYGLAAVSAVLLIGSALTAAFLQQDLDFPVVRALNAFAHRSAALDRTMHALTTRDLLQGVPFMGLIWFLWFSSEESSHRSRLIVGVLAASLAGAISRAMQLLLPTHLRPLHQPTLDFVLPFGVEPDALNHFNSFPSDHGAVFFALTAVIWRASPKLGSAAFVWALIIDFARIYEGYHFPTDVAGSIGLALALLCLLRNAHSKAPFSAAVLFEQQRRPWFYMIAFIVTYLVATLFDDVRELCRGMAAVLLHHDVFNGPSPG